MNLFNEYKQYVLWCDKVGANPIGYVNWKGKKFGYNWNAKKHIYENNK